MKIKMPLGYYDYTVVLTYVGMLCSFTAIMMSINEKFPYAVILLMMAGVCDMFDGVIASTKDRTPLEKRFGIQIDSLNDLISFGVMPAIFVYIITGKKTICAVITALFALAALIRLAYFNVDEEERQKKTNEKRSIFKGLPVTSIAILLPIVFWLQGSGRVHGKILYLILLILCGVGFLSPVDIKKPKLLGKICILIVGILELLGLLFLGWDLV